MPMRSKAQARLMFAASKSPAVAAKVGIRPAVAKKFVAESAGQKVRRLPERKGKR